MRRIALVLAMIGLLVPAAIAASPPAAAAVTMSGRIERVAVKFSGGPYLDIYGWSKDPRDVYTNNNLVNVTVTGPDGRAVSTAYDQPLLSTHSFTNGVSDHPDKDPRFGNTVHHGFSTTANVAKPGVYTVCAKAAPADPKPAAGSWTNLGCTKVTVPARKISGGLNTVGGHSGRSGLYIDGWVADSWNDFVPVSADLAITYTGPGGVPQNVLPPSAIVSGGGVDTPSASLTSQHPGVVGLHPLTAAIDPAPPGTYTVCAAFSSAGSVAPQSCVTATVASAYPTQNAIAPASTTLAVGSPVSLTPAEWSASDATIVDRLVLGEPARWSDSVDLSRNVLMTASAGGKLVVPASAAGQRVCLVETATVPGGIPMSQYFCYNAVVDTAVGRAAGADRYATAAAVSRKAFPSAGPRTVYIASGTSFADALSAGPVVAKTGSALLLTGASSLPPATKAELTRLRPAKVVVVGGAGVVSDAVLKQVRSLVPVVTRIGGADRYATSRAIIASAYGAGTAQRALVATGRDFPDALAAVPAAQALGAPILLVDGKARKADAATVAALKRLGTKQVTVLGGTGAVSSGLASSFGTGVTVSRASGADRYATSIAVSRLAYPGAADHAYLAAGGTFPDALAAASLQKTATGPLYLTPRSCVPVPTVTDLVRTKPEDVTILGGNGVLSYDSVVACRP
ncbi:cell wall-binding repeat-containing protein [Microbacterium sp. NPDC057659]|uniref:cell wall-binding repeat-containing protein n=1 Tax=Microbacterium sp. NPDC057659 TaxID=3346198 RepID=UPI0036731488